MRNPPHLKQTPDDFESLPLSTPVRYSWRECGVAVFLLLASRLLIIGILYKLTGGREFTDDGVLHLSMIRDPFQILFAHDRHNAQFPPLLPLFEAAFGYVLQLSVPSFWALRLNYILFEAAALILTWMIWAQRLGSQARRMLLITWILMPMTWMSTAVMEQEEMLTAAFFALTILLLLRGKHLAAIFCCAMGVVSAKIFFLVPLLALVIGPPLRPVGALARRLMAAATPILLVYAIAMFFWFGAGMGLPIAEFTPPVVLSTTFWARLSPWLGLSLEQTKIISMLLALIGGLTPLILIKYRSVDMNPHRIALLMMAMLMWVYVLFYEISPEYYCLLLPGLLVVLRPKWAVLVSFFVLPFAWAINFFFGVAHAMQQGGGGGKQVFVRLYQRIFSISPDLLHGVSIILFFVLTTALAIALTVQLCRRVPRPARNVSAVPVP